MNKITKQWTLNYRKRRLSWKVSWKISSFSRKEKYDWVEKSKLRSHL